MLSYREVGRLNLLRMHLQSLASQHRCHPLPLTPPPARERSGDMSPGAVGRGFEHDQDKGQPRVRGLADWQLREARRRKPSSLAREDRHGVARLLKL